MKKNKILLIFTIILVNVYLLWRLFFTIPTEQGWVSLVLGVILFYSELITALGAYDLMNKYISYKGDPEPAPITEAEYPDVDVLIATHNEEVGLLYKTVNACTYMDYPNKSKVHIFICDDTNRPEVKTLADQFGVGYFGLSNNTEAKSGNYNNAIRQTHSPYIATFDADMIPRSCFLMKTVPYLFLNEYKKDENGQWHKLSAEETQKNKKIGFVQTPQGFYNPDLFQYNLYSEKSIPNEQDFFSKELNVLRNTDNATVYTGSNTIISREALESIGLFPTNTITEDYETGLRIQANGYQTLSTTEVMACGITPNTLKSMISQRKRWARGVIQSTKNCHIPFNKGLSFGGNLTYFFGFSYWWSFFRRIVFFMAPIFFALFDIQIVNTDLWNILIFWLPSYILYTMSTRLLSSKLRTQRWNQIIDTIMTPFLILPVFFETIGISQKKFKVTDKSKKKEADLSYLMYSIPNFLLLVLSIAAMYRFVHGKYGTELLYGVVVIYWLLSNIINIIYAMYFLLGRKIVRNEERVTVKEPMVCDLHGLSLHGTTINLSENGACFELQEEHPEWCGMEKTLRISSERYSATFTVRILNCSKTKSEGDYLYRCLITNIDDANKRQYIQIIHDREIEATNELDKWMTTPDGIILNTHKHVQEIVSGKKFR